METLVKLICIVALAKYLLTAVQSGSLWRLAGYAAIAAVVALALYPVVIEQPVTIIAEWLTSHTAVSNLALLTTTEAIAGIFVSVYLLDNYFKPKSQRTKKAILLKILPGILAFAAIGYFELLFFKVRAGGDFFIMAVLYAVLLFVGVFVTGIGLRKVLTAESLRLEVKVILNMTILIVGLLVSSSVADYNISHAQTIIEWEALIVLTVGTLILIILGALLPVIKRINK